MFLNLNLLSILIIKKMKINLHFKRAILVLLTYMLLPSCEKEEGPQGPAGANGNANVKTSIFTGVGWTAVGNIYYCILSDSNITQEIVDNGFVNVYIQDANAWEALPYSWPISPAVSTINVFQYSLGQVQIDQIRSDLSAYPNPGPTTFKVVCVEGMD
jgi:hypothetical protein